MTPGISLSPFIKAWVSSPDRVVEDGNGDKSTELWELIPDGKAIDLDAELDARQTLRRLPKRLVFIGKKYDSGIPLTRKERDYLRHWRATKLAAFRYREVQAKPSVDHVEERILKCKSSGKVGQI